MAIKVILNFYFECRVCIFFCILCRWFCRGVHICLIINSVDSLFLFYCDIRIITRAPRTHAHLTGLLFELHKPNYLFKMNKTRKDCKCCIRDKYNCRSSPPTVVFMTSATLYVRNSTDHVISSVFLHMIISFE